MKKALPFFVFLLTASTALAYNPLVIQPPQPYDILPIEGDPYVEHQFLGTLEDYPEMFELTTDVSIDLKIKVRQKNSSDAVPFGLIMVRKNEKDGGVSEVARLNQPISEWKKISDAVLGMSFLESDSIEKNVSPGTYRIEVSTPDNKGAYMLMVGEEPQYSGFFKTIGQIYSTQKSFGYTPFHMLLSSYIFYPLGILLVLYGIYRTWRYRKEIIHVS